MIGNGRMLTAEIIGPAGVGKSTLSDLLNKDNSQIKAGITIWGLPSALLAQAAFASSLMITRILLGEGSSGLNRTGLIVRLGAFYRYLLTEKKFRKRVGKNYVEQKPDALLFDEGIVFALSKLRFEQNKQVYRNYSKDWEEKTLDRWANLLDLVIWLDASDEVLIERVRTRKKKHRMKTGSDAELKRFLGDYRRAYQNIVGRLQARGDLKILRFDTGNQTPETIARQIEEIVAKNGEEIKTFR